MIHCVIISAALAPAPSVDDVQAYVAFDAGVAIELEFNVLAVGRVGLSAYTDEDGDGGAFLVVDDVPVFELGLEAGELSTSVKFALPEKGELGLLGESILAVWREQAVEDAFQNAADGSRWKCWLAGSVAGKVAGVFASGVCAAVAGPLVAGCAAPAAVADVTVSGYVSNLCKQAQNK